MLSLTLWRGNLIKPIFCFTAACQDTQTRWKQPMQCCGLQWDFNSIIPEFFISKKCLMSEYKGLYNLRKACIQRVQKLKNSLMPENMSRNAPFQGRYFGHHLQNPPWLVETGAFLPADGWVSAPAYASLSILVQDTTIDADSLIVIPAAFFFGSFSCFIFSTVCNTLYKLFCLFWVFSD